MKKDGLMPVHWLKDDLILSFWHWACCNFSGSPGSDSGKLHSCDLVLDLSRRIFEKRVARK